MSHALLPRNLRPQPLKYRMLADTLRRKIVKGVYDSGDRLPSVAEMQRVHRVSLSTVNHAYSLLESEGLIVREHGRGTFVAPHHSGVRAMRLGALFHVHSYAGAYISQLRKGIQQAASAKKAKLLWLASREVEQEDKIDGLLLYCHPTEALALDIPEHIPKVLLFQHDPHFTCVSPDDFDGSYRLA